MLLADKEANYREVVSLDPALARVRWRQTAPDRWTTSRVLPRRGRFLSAVLLAR